eukprot:scaffold3282_cov101-Isochrysis_galbana.AAC.2
MFDVEVVRNVVRQSNGLKLITGYLLGPLYSCGKMSLYSTFVPGDETLTTNGGGGGDAEAPPGRATRGGDLPLHGSADLPKLKPGDIFRTTTAGAALDAASEVPPGIAVFVGILLGERKTQTDKYIVYAARGGDGEDGNVSEQPAICFWSAFSVVPADSPDAAKVSLVDAVALAPRVFNSKLFQSRTPEGLQKAIARAASAWAERTEKAGEAMQAGTTAGAGSRRATRDGSGGVVTRADPSAAAGAGSGVQLNGFVEEYRTAQWPDGFAEKKIQNHSELQHGALRIEAMLVVAKETSTISKRNERLLDSATAMTGVARTGVLVRALQSRARAQKRVVSSRTEESDDTDGLGKSASDEEDGQEAEEGDALRVRPSRDKGKRNGNGGREGGERNAGGADGMATGKALRSNVADRGWGLNKGDGGDGLRGGAGGSGRRGAGGVGRAAGGGTGIGGSNGKSSGGGGTSGGTSRGTDDNVAEIASLAGGIASGNADWIDVDGEDTGVDAAAIEEMAAAHAKELAAIKRRAAAMETELAKGREEAMRLRRALLDSELQSHQTEASRGNFEDEDKRNCDISGAVPSRHEGEDSRDGAGHRRNGHGVNLGYVGGKKHWHRHHRHHRHRHHDHGSGCADDDGAGSTHSSNYSPSSSPAKPLAQKKGRRRRHGDGVAGSPSPDIHPLGHSRSRSSFRAGDSDWDWRRLRHTNDRSHSRSPPRSRSHDDHAGRHKRKRHHNRSRSPDLLDRAQFQEAMLARRGLDRSAQRRQREREDTLARWEADQQFERFLAEKRRRRG